MWSPQTTGVAPAGPGRGSLHARLSALSNLVGRFFSSQTPLLCGPRHWGQLSARTGTITTPERASMTKPTLRLRRDIGLDLWEGFSEGLGGSLRQMSSEQCPSAREAQR